MARNEEGEFELILGNRQLLSVFFIVVVLLGLCFLMGYVIGRNSAPVVNAENVPTSEESGDPLVIPPASENPPETTAAAEPPPQTAPQTPAESAPLPPPKPAPTAPPPAAKEEPKQTAKQETKLPPLPPAPGTGPAAGTYLQLSATLRAEAEAYIDRLRGKGFSATMAQVPGQDRYRVLVGPFADSPAEIQRMRTRLNAESFPGNDAIPRRY